MPEYAHFQDYAVIGRLPGSSVCPGKPGVANEPTRLRFGVFVVACGLLDSDWCSGGTDVQPIFGIGL